MPDTQPTLHMLCGKSASGKSTLGARLADRHRAVLISEDAWLHALFGGEMASIADYMRCMEKLRRAMGPHIADVLGAGLSVVLDFQANTPEARGCMRGILDRTEADHRLHVLDVPDTICLQRLHARNNSGDHPFFVTDDQFHAITTHFTAPSEAEGFTLVHHQP